MQANKLFNKNFVLLFQGQLVSQIGSAAYILALTFWLKHTTGSATLMGLFSMAALIPGVLLGPLGGTLADHFSRKKIIVIADILNGLMITGIACLMLFFPEKVDLIVALLFVEAVINGILMAVFRPAVSAIVPDLVPVGSLSAANGLMQNSMMVSQLIGQSVGGVLFRILGAPILLLIDGVSYLLSALSESFIKVPENKAPEKQLAHDGEWADKLKKFSVDTLDGFRFMKRLQGMKALLLVSAVMNFFLAPFGVLLPFFVEDTLGSTPDWFGFMIAGVALGSIIGAVIAGAARLAPRHKGKAVIFGLIFIALAFAVFGYSDAPITALLILFCIGICSGAIGVWITSAVQLSTPANMRGRVFGLLTTLSTALAPISLGLAGVAIDLVDKNVTLIFTVCGLCVLSVIPVLFFNKPFHLLMATEHAQPDNLKPDEAASTIENHEQNI